MTVNPEFDALYEKVGALITELDEVRKQLDELKKKPREVVLMGGSSDINKTQADADYVNVSGDTMTGTLNTQNLEASTTETYTIGETNKYLRAHVQSRDLVGDRLARVSLFGKVPSDYPVVPDETYPMIDLYAENPIGTPSNRFTISNIGGALYFSLIDTAVNIFDVFGFVYTSPTDMVVNFKGSLLPIDVSTWKIGDVGLEWKELHVDTTARLPYETQSGAWVAPSDTPPNGSFKVVYNSTQNASRLYIYSNSGWRYASLT